MSDFVPSQRLQVHDSITTGQAVVLDVTPASPIVRMAASLVDVFVTFACFVSYLRLFPYLFGDLSMSSLRTVGILTFVTLTVFIPFTVETLTQGRSLGKWIFDLQVVRDDGGVITARHSLVRTLVGVVEVWLTLGSIATFTCIMNIRSKRLGDFAAGTTLIQHPKYVPSYELVMPPDAAAWARQAQIVRLPQDLVLRATLFLRGTATIDMRIRYDASVQIAQELLAFVEPAPPQDLHPERFIAAVLVVNRDRDAAKLERWEAQSLQARRNYAQADFGVH